MIGVVVLFVLGMVAIAIAALRWPWLSGVFTLILIAGAWQAAMTGSWWKCAEGVFFAFCWATSFKSYLRQAALR